MPLQIRFRILQRSRRIRADVRRRVPGDRMLPGFLIAGAQRCGTSSVYDYLVSHPDVGAALTKEVHYFDLHYGRGPDWYRANFPAAGRAEITGEASPYYLFHPLSAARVAADLPAVKSIVLLRDPVERALSHYKHERARGAETLGFAEAIEAEPERTAGEQERLSADPKATSFAHQHYTYLARGCYAEQLERWLSHIPRERTLIVGYERFFADPAAGMARIWEFLGLPAHRQASYARLNATAPSRMDEAMRARLVAHFREPNRHVQRLTGLDLGWPD